MCVYKEEEDKWQDKLSWGIFVILMGIYVENGWTKPLIPHRKIIDLNKG